MDLYGGYEGKGYYGNSQQGGGKGFGGKGFGKANPEHHGRELEGEARTNVTKDNVGVVGRKGIKGINAKFKFKKQRRVRTRGTCGW